MRTYPVFRAKRLAFTLVEMLVSVSVLALIMLVLVSMTNQISQTWRSTTGKIGQFQVARDGFESMTRKISQATLNTYLDLYYGDAVKDLKTPIDFYRRSRLRFISGPMAKLAPDATRPTHGIFFQAPLGFVEDSPNLVRSENLLNSWGYFVEVSEDDTFRPSFLQGKVPNRWKPRLMEFMEPSDKMSVYSSLVTYDSLGKITTTPVSKAQQLDWFAKPLSAPDRPVRVLAENIVALVVWPRLAKKQEDIRRDADRSVLAPNYIYDSSLQSFSEKFPFMDPATGLPATVYLNEGSKSADYSSSDPQVAGEVNPFNQLPPVVQVTMVALDDLAAQRFVDRFGKGALTEVTEGLFTVACQSGTKSNQQTQYEKDLATLEQRLVDKKLTYRVFSTNVTIRGAKWSSFQTRSLDSN